MGGDWSHGDAHLGHRHFHASRETLEAMVGIQLDSMSRFGGTEDWSPVTGPLAPLLSRNAAGGELGPDECRDAATRLEELMAEARNRHEVRGDQREELMAGLKEAAAAGEPLVNIDQSTPDHRCNNPGLPGVRNDPRLRSVPPRLELDPVELRNFAPRSNYSSTVWVSPRSSSPFASEMFGSNEFRFGQPEARR